MDHYTAFQVEASMWLPLIWAVQMLNAHTSFCNTLLASLPR